MRMWFNGKLVVLDIIETGRQIEEKLAVVLSTEQQINLAQYFLYANGKGNDTDSFLRKFSNTLDAPLTEIRAGDLYLCLEQRLVTVREQEIYLTVKEFEILFLLASNPNRVLTYELIMDMVWHEDYTYCSRKAINNHVCNLRKKLKTEPGDPDYIKSVTGIGYKFALP
jgi:DNA-binding response OmpR family regulator